MFYVLFVACSYDAVRAMQYMSNFFVDEARSKGLGRGNVENGGEIGTQNPNIRYFPMKLTSKYNYVFE